VTNTQDRAAFLFGKTDTRRAEEFLAKTTMDDDDVGLAQTSLLKLQEYREPFPNRTPIG